MSVILFAKTCYYDKINDETTIYGHYKRRFIRIQMEGIDFQLIFSDSSPDFCIKLKGRFHTIETILFLYENDKVTLENIVLDYPFEYCDLSLNATSAIISTMCKNYSHRLDEWIRYNIKLGFSGIVIFNNDGNTSNEINEPTENCIQKHSMKEICDRYKGKVWMIDFPYSQFINDDWNNIQRMSLHIGVNAFRTKCRNIALIDADEFIHLPNNTGMNIEDFLQMFCTITMMSNILTNKNDDDLLDNNILDLAKYLGENKYTKTILHTDSIRENEFITTPHNHYSGRLFNKTEIIHYHCWMNKRYKYDENMEYIDVLSR